MKKLAFILLLFPMIANCQFFGKMVLDPGHEDEPNRTLYLFLGQPIGETNYQIMELTFGEDDRFWTIASTTCLNIGVPLFVANMEKWCNGWEQKHGCHFGAMAFSAMINLLAHQITWEMDRDWSLYRAKQHKVKLKKEMNAIKKEVYTQHGLVINTFELKIRIL